MAYFRNRPKKPGSRPGAGSGFEEERQEAHRRRTAKRLERGLKVGRPGRPGRNLRAARAAR